MRIRLTSGDITAAQADVAITGFFEGTVRLSGATSAVDAALGGAIAREIEEIGFEGKEGQMMVVPTQGMMLARKVIVIGLGKKETFSFETVRRVSAVALKRAVQEKAKVIATVLHSDSDPLLVTQALVEGALLSLYHFSKYKTTTAERKHEPQELVIVESDTKKQRAMTEGVFRGTLFVEGATHARDLVNEPPEFLVPKTLADEAKKIAKKNPGVTVKIFDKKAIQKMGMGGVIGVAQGSDDAPYFVHLTYKPKKAKNQKKIFLVGKGVTFDTGGISLKPSNAMDTMKMDMAGAASVLGIFSVIGKLKPDVEVHGVFAAVENAPSGSAIKPSDVLRAMNGKTMEVANTDAEGRLILADALSYSVTQGATEMIDLATLTGACVVALGDDIAGLFANDKKVSDKLLNMSEKTGEKIWELPLEMRYKEHIKSRIADVKNTGKSGSGGVITAALFLHEFVGETSWAHIDIAGPAWQETDAHPYQSHGGTGFGVRLLLEYLLC